MPEEIPAADAAEPSAGGGPLSGTKGWILVIAALVLEATFFGVLLWFKDSPAPTDEAHSDDRPVGITLAELQRTIEVKGLSYTINTPGQGSMALALAFTLELGTTPEERENPKKAPSDIEFELIKAVVNSYLPRLRSHLNSYIPGLGIGIIQSPNGQRLIQEEIRRFLNSGLRDMNLKDFRPEVNRDRVTQVNIIEFQTQADG